LVFPLEAEHRAKRRAMGLLQEHLRKVLDVYRKITQLTDAYLKSEVLSLDQLNEEVLHLGDAVEDSKRIVAQELVEIGAILISREDFLRFTDVISEVADFCKGISFRINELNNRNWDVPHELKLGIMDLAEAVFSALTNLRDTLLMLNYGSPKVFEKAKNIEEAETKVDVLYRKLEIKILDANLNIQPLILIRDIVQLFGIHLKAVSFFNLVFMVNH
jgi:uncharacterized protein Yka (UPF0111/DUF47 family)